MRVRRRSCLIISRVGGGSLLLVYSSLLSGSLSTLLLQQVLQIIDTKATQYHKDKCTCGDKRAYNTYQWPDQLTVKWRHGTAVYHQRGTENCLARSLSKYMYHNETERAYKCLYI